MTTAETLTAITAKAKALTDRYPDRPAWVVRELDFYREIYKHVRGEGILQTQLEKEQEQYRRLEEFVELFEECFYQVMRWRPDCFEYNSPQPTILGVWAWLKLLQLLPHSDDRRAALKFLQDSTPNTNEPYQETTHPTFAPVPKYGTYNIYERNNRK